MSDSDRVETFTHRAQRAERFRRRKILSEIFEKESKEEESQIDRDLILEETMLTQLDRMLW